MVVIGSLPPDQAPIQSPRCYPFERYCEAAICIRFDGKEAMGHIEDPSSQQDMLQDIWLLRPCPSGSDVQVSGHHLYIWMAMLFYPHFHK